MIKPYVSKRRKIDSKPDENKKVVEDLKPLPKSDNVSILKVHWTKDSHFNCITNALGSHANEICWSPDGLYLAVGVLKGDVSLIFCKETSIHLLKLSSISSVPRCVSWGRDNSYLRFMSHHGQYHIVDIKTGKSNEFKVDNQLTVNSALAWKDYTVLGCKQLYLCYNRSVVKIFGPQESNVSSMVVVDDILFVAYDYSQTSSSDKSIIAFTLPSGAPISNKLTDSMYSYTCLRYSAPFIYGMTSNGEITRFNSRTPLKVDKKFKVKVELPYGYKSQFDIRNSIIAYGNAKGELAFEILPDHKKNKTCTPTPSNDFASECPIVNVAFHPKFDYIAASKWDGTFGILRF